MGTDFRGPVVGIRRTSRGSSEIRTLPAPFRGWSVRGRAEAGRPLDSFSNFSARFLRCGEPPAPASVQSHTRAGGGRPGPSFPTTRRASAGAAAEPGATAGGRRTDGWTHPPALGLSPARGSGGSLGPGERRRVPGRGRSASLPRHPRPLGRPRLAPPAPGCAPEPASLAAKADGTRSGASQKGAWSPRRGRASPRAAAAFPAADLAAAPAPAPAPQRPPAASAVPAPERSPRPEPEPEPEPGASPARGRRGCG